MRDASGKKSYYWSVCIASNIWSSTLISQCYHRTGSNQVCFSVSSSISLVTQKEKFLKYDGIRKNDKNLAKTDR